MIELLVVIAIIGILSTIAITSLNSARKKANDAAFQSSAAGVVQSLTLCCDSNNGAGVIGTAAGAAMCTPDVAGTWPTASTFSAIAKAGGTNKDCDNGTFQVTLTNGKTNSNLTTAVCSQDGCNFS